MEEHNQPKIIAVSGKGGVGKTSLAAVIVKLLVSAYSGKKILAIDADPAVGLSTALGIDPEKTVDDVRKEAIAAAGAAPARTPAAAPNPNPNTNPNRAPRVYTELRPQEAPSQPQPVAQPRRQPAAREYTDISSASGRGSTQARQTRQQPAQNSRDIYSSSRGQGYAYSTSAHLRNQDEAAAEERRRKIELLKQLQREQRFTELMAAQEALKTMPWGAVWEEFCARQQVPGDEDWMPEILAYEKDVLLKREEK